jgi:hypothetical protein
MYYIGLDVHKKTISYCVKDVSGQIHRQGTFGATRNELDWWVPQSLIQRQRTLKGLALDVLHHQVIRPHVVERANVGMIQRRHSASFALETLAELGLGNLDGHDAIQAGVTSLVDIAHSARTDWRKDFVGAEFFPRR